MNEPHPAYRHIPKHARPAPPLANGTGHLKWTLVHPAALPITEAEIAAAQHHLTDEIAHGGLAIADESGFVVQHRTPEWLILYVVTWRHDNEAWETLYLNHLPQGAGYAQLDRENTTPTFCVWVLQVVAHEQRAWSRYLTSERTDTDREAWLTDGMTGEVI